MSEPKKKQAKVDTEEKEEEKEWKDCVNSTYQCDDATLWTTCPTCESILCDSCAKESDWCIDFGTSFTIEMPNTCSTCKKRICNNCARMCLIGEKDICKEEVGNIECKDCAKDKYENPKCGCANVWLCKGADGHYCPEHRYWENAFGKMGYH